MTNYERARYRREQAAAAERKRRNVLMAIATILVAGFALFCMFILSGYRRNEPSDFIYHKEIPMERELQEHLWTQCKMWGVDYGLALGSIEQESHFKIDAVSGVNNNGTIDIGICQVNSRNVDRLKRLGMIEKQEDLLDPYKNIECGMFILGVCVEEFGNTEQAYYYYNTGKKRFGSNKSSRKVWEYTQKWHRLLEVF